MSHKAWLVIHIKWIEKGLQQLSISRELPQEVVREAETFCWNHTGHAISWGLRERRKRKSMEGGRQANWTEWLSPTSAALPDEVWLGCVYVCVSLLQYCEGGLRPHGIINYRFLRECVKSLAVIITLSARLESVVLGHYLANDRTRPDVQLYGGKAKPGSDKSGHCDVVNLAISIYLK